MRSQSGGSFEMAHFRSLATTTTVVVVVVVLTLAASPTASAAIIPSGGETMSVIAVPKASSSAGAQSSSSSSSSSSSGVAVELDELLPPDGAENGTVHRVVAQIGETVLLPCKAYSLGQRTVSWVRRRDWHIMSSGTTVYTADSRFSVINRPGSPDWILMLKSPQLHDSGTYECQIVGGQGQVSQYVDLLVWSPVAVVSEGGEHHVEAESNIQLHCQMRPQAPILPSGANSSTSKDHHPIHRIAMPTISGTPFVWYHNGRPLKDGLKSAGGLGTIRIHLLDGQEASDGVASRLEIMRADHADSGNYTCAPWRGTAASVSVFVSQGDKPAAVQRQAALRSSIPLNVLIFGLNFLLLQVR